MTFWSGTSDVPHRLGRLQADGVGTRYMEAGERYAAAIPGARLEVFDASSHMPQFEEPERFDAALLDFLARARAATAGTR